MTWVTWVSPTVTQQGVVIVDDDVGDVARGRRRHQRGSR